ASVRPTRQLKINSIEPSSPSPSNNASAKAPKDKSPKVTEVDHQRPRYLSERATNHLKIIKKAKKQLADVSSKLEESQKQLIQLHALKHEYSIELHNNSEEKEREWEAQIGSVHKQHLLDSAALTSALDEIHNLKLQIEKVCESGDQTQVKQSETAHAELQSLKDDLSENLAQNLVRETLLQLEAAKETVNALRSDVIRST
ncbi:Interactor of constitutive active ROPs 3, partial [Bienertia sinuspersici]